MWNWVFKSEGNVIISLSGTWDDVVKEPFCDVICADSYPLTHSYNILITFHVTSFHFKNSSKLYFNLLYKPEVHIRFDLKLLFGSIPLRIQEQFADWIRDCIYWLNAIDTVIHLSVSMGKNLTIAVWTIFYPFLNSGPDPTPLNSEKTTQIPFLLTLSDAKITQQIQYYLHIDKSMRYV